MIVVQFEFRDFDCFKEKAYKILKIPNKILFIYSAQSLSPI
jgi:hypothetical protein